MQKLFVVLFVAFIFSPKVYSQFKKPIRAFEKIVYSGLNPIWHVTSIDTAFISDSTDGYNHYFNNWAVYDPPLIYQDHFYNIHYYRGNPNLAGTYIEKRNLQSGALVWQVTYGLSSQEFPEFARLLYINKDGHLEVFGQLKSSPINPQKDLFYFKDMVFSRRIYDIDSGDLIDYKHPELNDTTIAHSWFGFFQANSLHKDVNSDSIWFYEGNLIEQNDSILYYIGGASVNLQSKKSDLGIYKHFPSGSMVYALDDVRFLKYQPHKSRKFFKLWIVDKKLQVMDSIVSEIIPKSLLGDVELLSYDKQKDLYLFKNIYYNDDFFSTQTSNFFILNGKGQFVKIITMPLKYETQSTVLDWSDLDDIHILSISNTITAQKKLYCFLDVLQFDQNDSLNLVKRFYALDSLRSAYSIKSYKLDDETFLLDWTEISGYYAPPNGMPKFDSNGFARSLLKVHKSNLGITSSVTKLPYSFVDVYPNPTSGHLLVSFELPFSGKIYLYDSQGRLISSKDSNESSLIEWDIQDVLPGVYHLIAKEKSGGRIFSAKKVVKVQGL